MSAEEARKVTNSNSDEWMSLGEASRMLGQSRQTILSRAIKGELEAQYIAGRTVVSRESVERAKGAA